MDHWRDLKDTKYPDEKSSIKSASSIAGVNTPEYTTILDELDEDVGSPNEDGIEAVPWPGGTFVIIHRASGRAICMNEEGHVRLTSIENIGMSTHCHWKCVERDGWLGFKHAGRFLGRDDEGGFRAEVRHHDYWEFFCAKRHPDGGYQLMTLHWWIQRGMDVLENDDKLIERPDRRAALWTFVKV